MTYHYDERVERYGRIEGRYYSEGTYITPDGKLFDVEGLARVAHAGGFVVPFFKAHMHPDKKYIRYYDKQEIYETLLEWEKELITKKYDVNPKEQQMRLKLVQYFQNIYKSKNSIWDFLKEEFDFSKTSGIPNNEENWIGRDEILKTVLVQSCNYDAIESSMYRTITTSKFNIYEIFYDYILHDYKIIQIPKKIYKSKEERYMDYLQPERLISDKELRIKKELDAICKETPIEEREKYSRSKIKIIRYDFFD